SWSGCTAGGVGTSTGTIRAATLAGSDFGAGTAGRVRAAQPAQTAATAMPAIDTYPRVRIATRGHCVTISSRRCYEHTQPLGPVSAELEEIVEVAKADRLQLNHQIAEHVVGWQWPDRDQSSFDRELLVGQIEARIDGVALQPHTLERFASDEDRRAVTSNGDRHVRKLVVCPTFITGPHHHAKFRILIRRNR